MTLTPCQSISAFNFLVFDVLDVVLFEKKICDAVEDVSAHPDRTRR